MTLADFNAIATWSELDEACAEFDCFDIFYENDIESDEQLDEYINEYVNNCRDSWYELRDTLNDIPQGFEFYKIYNIGDIVGLFDGDSYFDDIKDEIREYAEERGYFDEEEIVEEIIEEEVEEEPEDEFDYDAVETINDQNINGFFMESTGILVAYNKKTNEKLEEEEKKHREVENMFDEISNRKAVLL